MTETLRALVLSRGYGELQAALRAQCGKPMSYTRFVKTYPGADYTLYCAAVGANEELFEAMDFLKDAATRITQKEKQT